MVLRGLARDLKSLLHNEDLLGRYSDNVLTVFFLELDTAHARSQCEALINRLAQSDNALLARSNVAIGLVESFETPDSIGLLKEALRRLEGAWRLGGNRIVDHPVPVEHEIRENLQSIFISYGGPDQAFAEKLNKALKLRGVQTFFFHEDAPPGDKLHDVMRAGVNTHDRVILICSKESLERPGLLNELEETLAREARNGGATYLLPVRLDDYVIDQWKPAKPGLAQTIRDRVIADFRDHSHPTAFAAAVAKVLAVLTKREEKSFDTSVNTRRSKTIPG
ncbi:MAG TPA: TIR domain-containing protein [Polyangia bacterium]|nr:TIR domain-containing protein [Polyangia bacterium]